MQRIAVYPGTFDPFTNGHLDIVIRSVRLFDKLIVAVTTNPKKNTLFTIKERCKLIEAVVKNIENVEVDCFNTLLVDYVSKIGSVVIIRGLRAVSDFEYELQMALLNRRLNPNVDTIFKMPSEDFTFITSTAVKEIASFGGPVSELVPPIVEVALRQKYLNQEITLI